jgi:hypothetical protein
MKKIEKRKCCEECEMYAQTFFGYYNCVRNKTKDTCDYIKAYKEENVQHENS